MKKLLLAVLVVAGLSVKAHAYTEIFDQGFSTWTVVGVKCSSGPTPTSIGGGTPGFRISTYRLQNQDDTEAVWIGHDANLSSTTVSANTLARLGEKLTPNSNGTWNIGVSTASVRLSLFCIAEDAAGAAGVILSKSVWSYK